MVLQTSPIKAARAKPLFQSAPPNLPPGGLQRKSEENLLKSDSHVREAELAYAEAFADPYYQEIPYDTPHYLLPSVRNLLNGGSTISSMGSSFTESKRPFASSARSRGRLPVPKLPWKIPSPPTSDPRQVQRLYNDAKRKNDRWQTRMFDPPVTVSLKSTLVQVKKQEQQKMKANMSTPKIKPHLPRQPTSRHFKYDYINSRQKRVVKKELKKEKKLAKKQTCQIKKRMQIKKKDNQDEYNPRKKRQPPAHTKALAVDDVYFKGQMAQLHDPKLQQESFDRQQEDQRLSRVLFEQQKAERLLRMQQVKQQQTFRAASREEFEEARKLENKAKEDLAYAQKTLKEAAKGYTSTVLNSASRIEPGSHHDDLPDRINQLFEHGREHNLRWPTRMFDPPIEVPMSDVMTQVKKEHDDKVRQKKANPPSPHHPRQPTSRHFHFDYTTTTTQRHHEAKEKKIAEDTQKQQQQKQKRLTTIRTDHKEEYEPQKVRTPPASTRPPPTDEFDKRQHDQWHNTDLHQQTLKRLEDEQVLEKEMFEQQRQKRQISAKQLQQRKTMHFEDKSAFEAAKAAEAQLHSQVKMKELAIDTHCLEYASNILCFQKTPPMSTKDAPPLKKEQADLVTRHAAEEKRKTDRWKNRMFDPPVSVPLQDVLKQVEDEHKDQIKARVNASKVQPHHPRQPTSRHFEYDYINSAQRRQAEEEADRVAQDTLDQQKNKEKRMSMRKAQTQAEYVPTSPRAPPSETRKPPADVYTRMQLDQIHNKQIHDATHSQLTTNKEMQSRLEQLQAEERQKRVSMVQQKKTAKFVDKSAYEEAKALERSKRQTILKGKVELDTMREEIEKFCPTQPSEHADRLHEDSKRRHDRWQTRMFDPPVEVELKEVLKQVKIEENEKVIKNVSGEKPQPHYPRQPTSLHHDFDFTTTTEMKKVKAKEAEDMRVSKMQHDAMQKRKTVKRDANRQEYDVNKPRAPPAEARALPKDVYSKKQVEQFKDDKNVEKNNEAFVAEATRVQDQFKSQEVRRKTMRKAKHEEEKKQREALAATLMEQKQKRATIVQARIQLGASAEVERPKTSNVESAYSTRVDAGGRAVEMRYYDPTEDEAVRPSTAPSKPAEVAKYDDDDEDSYEDNYEDD